MHFKFQSFVDISTSASSMQVIQWSVGGADVVNRCRHLFGAYKYFKLGRIDIKMIPASTLPVDPQGLSYDADDPLTVDPRDQMNPGLVRITNGEDVYTDVSSLSDAQQERVYQTMMLDPRWSKFMLQSGFRRSALPLYWQVGQLQQDAWPGSITNIPLISNAGNVSGIAAKHEYDLGSPTDDYAVRTNGGSAGRGLFQVGHKGRIGWLPTDFYQDYPISGDDRFNHERNVNNVPEVRVITCVLPKAYKTVYYYRVFITEHVYFSGIKSAMPVFDNGSGSLIQTPGIDTFMFSDLNKVYQDGTNTLNYWTNERMNNGDQVQ